MSVVVCRFVLWQFGLESPEKVGGTECVADFETQFLFSELCKKKKLISERTLSCDLFMLFASESEYLCGFTCIVLASSRECEIHTN